jgi:hypothetical protein
MDRYFSIGTRAARAQAARTTYQMRAGPRTDEDITAADGQQWDLGHGIGRSGTSTFGFSVGKSKIWEPKAADSLFAFRGWCEELATRVANPALGLAQSKLDVFGIADALATFPEDPIAVVLPFELYASPIEVDGETVLAEVVEFHPTAAAGDVVSFELRVRGAPRGEIEFTVAGRVTIRGAVWTVNQGEFPLEEVLQHEPPIIFFADGARVSGAHITPPPPRLAFVDQRVRVPRDWIGTDICAEFGPSAQGLRNVGDTVAELLSHEYPIVIQDHLPGELADFISIDDSQETISVCLTHCKSSSSANPAARVGDVQELVAQSIRSVFWLNQSADLWTELAFRLDNRNATFLRTGDVAAITALLVEWSARPPLTDWTLQLVQAGLSEAALDSAPRVTTLINAAHYWATSQSVSFQVSCSP